MRLLNRYGTRVDVCNLRGVVRIVAAAGIALGLHLPPTLAAEETPSEELARRETDPTLSPMSLQLVNDFALSYYGKEAEPFDGTGYDLELRPVIPFTAWSHSNIARLTIPYQISGPGPEGMKEVTIFDIVVFPMGPGRFAIGPVMVLRPASDAIEGHFGLGPAVGYVKTTQRRTNFGLFTQTVFGDITTTNIQPIYARQLGRGWSLSLGDLQWIWDWDEGNFSAMPLGVQIGKVLNMGSQPMRFALNPQYNLRNLAGSPEFSLLFTAAILFPEKK